MWLPKKHVGDSLVLKPTIRVIVFCRLSFHLPDQQYVTFQEGTSLQSVIDQNAETKLTKFFELNRHVCALIASGNQSNHLLL